FGLVAERIIERKRCDCGAYSFGDSDRRSRAAENRGVKTLNQGSVGPFVNTDDAAEDERLAAPDKAGEISRLKELKRAAGAFLKELKLSLRLTCAFWIVRRRLSKKGRGKRIRWARPR